MRGGLGRLLQKGRSVMVMNCPVLLSPSLPHSSALPLLRTAAATMSGSSVIVPGSAAQQKRALRSEIRKALKALPPGQRAQEDTAIQNIILDSSWFKSTRGLCAYISCESLHEVDTSRILAEVLSDMNDGEEKKRLYVPRVEDKNSHMQMLKISSIKDLIANSMNILEPSPIDADGSQREDVMLASHPVDVFLVPGVAFDRHGRRLGRGGGYYDVFLTKYQELAMERRWKQPLLVALAYSVQIMDDDVIPVTHHDVLVDALVSASGVIPISPAAMDRM
ncbi:5-formyltetrahydrofolate cyclo-ligase, mitochondrial [Phoenix dactylifera]|uniref:5-formyltetrahydrofolate cyclo-ligase n=2 Tax=Phoenix dactylifera TaxID=42345 RepID=A0A8B8ZDH8_PHODC|nr:5-formyltetrahydrofolate cyclo-ligase, mitochondrial [Phoenix dactylifera]